LMFLVFLFHSVHCCEQHCHQTTEIRNGSPLETTLVPNTVPVQYKSRLLEA
jgi:hypothetical protein